MFGVRMASLRLVLRANALSCLVFGALFSIAPAAVARFLGDAPETAVFVIGILLIGNAAHLFFAAMRPALIRAEVIWFSLGDLLWWSGSLALLATQVWVTSDRGILVTWLVAVAVAGLGLAQLWLLGRATAGLHLKAYWRSIGASWLALPLWVKVWLFWLNGVFLAALFFVPSELSRIVLIAYVAAGPLLLAFAFFEGGLSRLMGLGHLLPWAPMVVWLVMWLWQTGLTSPDAVYGVVLAVTTMICLGFDIYDVRRWLRGDRAILGSEQILVPG